MREGTRHNTGQDVTVMARKILGLFREEGVSIISGEELSASLNISRTAVWKHIKALKILGYRFEALPSQGYRLMASPDLLVPAEIQTGLAPLRVGKKVICFPETESTNQVAFKLAEEGADDGTVVIADTQTRGKGRLGRQWASPPGANLYCSIILRPDIPPVSAYQLTFLSAVAVARAVEQTAPLAPRIKWPNDILINGRKVAGLLNEMSAETEKVNFVILGIGVNINMRHDQFPQELRHPASSLMLEAGSEFARVGFIRALLRELDLLYDLYLAEGDEPIRKEWLSRCNTLGRRVNVESGGSVFSGVVSGLGDYGALLVVLPDGREEQILSGDVTLADEQG